MAASQHSIDNMCACICFEGYVQMHIYKFLPRKELRSAFFTFFFVFLLPAMPSIKIKSEGNNKDEEQHTPQY